MSNKWKVDKEDLDEIILEEEAENPNNKNFVHSWWYTVIKNNEQVATYQVWISSVGATATIVYWNNFNNEKDEEVKNKYVGKGYTKRGLNILCKRVFEKKLAPIIKLDINKNNIASQAIAKYAGFIQTGEKEYELLNPKAEELLLELLERYKESPYTSMKLERQLKYVKKRREELLKIKEAKDKV